MKLRQILLMMLALVGQKAAAQVDVTLPLSSSVPQVASAGSDPVPSDVLGTTPPNITINPGGCPNSVTTFSAFTQGMPTDPGASGNGSAQ